MKLYHKNCTNTNEYQNTNTKTEQQKWTNMATQVLIQPEPDFKTEKPQLKEEQTGSNSFTFYKSIKRYRITFKGFWISFTAVCLEQFSRQCYCVGMENFTDSFFQTRFVIISLQHKLQDCTGSVHDITVDCLQQTYVNKPPELFVHRVHVFPMRSATSATERQQKCIMALVCLKHQ